MGFSDCLTILDFFFNFVFFLWVCFGFFFFIFLDLFEIFFGFFWIFWLDFFYGFFSKVLCLLLKFTKVTTGHQKWPKMGQNSIISCFLCPGILIAPAEGLPSAGFFLPFWQKKNLIMLYLPNFGHFGFPAVTFVTFSSNLSSNP